MAVGYFFFDVEVVEETPLEDQKLDEYTVNKMLEPGLIAAECRKQITEYDKALQDAHIKIKELENRKCEEVSE